MQSTTHRLWRNEVILSFTVTVFVQGTEDESKVFAAFRQIVPENVRVDRQQLKGHFGNSIVLLKARTKEAQTMRKMIDGIRCALSRHDLMKSREQAPHRLSETHSVVFKFDKQAAARGLLMLGRKDPITVRAKIALNPNDARVC